MSAVLHGGLRRDGTSPRWPLPYALGASLALHAALLLLGAPGGDSAPEEPPPEPIHARLVAPPPPPAPPAPKPAPPAAIPPAVTQAPEVAPSPKPKVRETPKAPPTVRPAPKPRPKPEPEATADPVPAARPKPQAPTPSPALEPEREPESPAESAPSTAAPEPTDAPSAAEGADARGESAEARAVDTYRAQLIETARRYKRYPRVALDNNWEGKVVVRLAVGADGRIAALDVSASAGYPALDRQALEMIRKAKEVVPLPAALRGTAFTLEIPVIYELKDAGAR